MNIIVEGTAKCKRCNNQFEWRTKRNDKAMNNILIVGQWDSIVKNVLAIQLVNNKFIVKLSCPKCGKQFFVEKLKAEGEK